VDPVELEHRFAFHPANTTERQDAHQLVRRTCHRAAQNIEGLCPDGREKSLAITKLEEAMMWANAAIARAPGP
jgi:hypothetical protein